MQITFPPSRSFAHKLQWYHGWTLFSSGNSTFNWLHTYIHGLQAWFKVHYMTFMNWLSDEKMCVHECQKNIHLEKEALAWFISLFELAWSTDGKLKSTTKKREDKHPSFISRHAYTATSCSPTELPSKDDILIKLTCFIIYHFTKFPQKLPSRFYLYIAKESKLFPS